MTEPEFIIIKNMLVVKRKKNAKRKPSRFIHLVEDYLERISDPENELSRFRRNRALKIVKHITVNGVPDSEVKVKTGM